MIEGLLPLETSLGRCYPALDHIAYGFFRYFSDKFSAFFALLSVGALESCVGVTPVLRRCYAGVTPVLRRCYAGVTPVLHRCYAGVTPVLRRCYAGVTPAFV